MKIIFFPSDSKTNQYGNVITRGLTEYGFEFVKYEEVFSNIKLFRSVGLVHLNWFETLGTDTWSNIKRFFGRAAKLLILKISGKRIVWTMHNKIPHDNRSLWLKKNFMRLLVQMSDVIVVHSKVSITILTDDFHCPTHKIKHIPHPDYIGVYPVFRTHLIAKHVDPTIFNLLFFGAVKPYKNIELLIDVFKQIKNENTFLTIAGHASEKYKEEIISYVGNCTNIILKLSFVSDEDIIKLISECDLVVLPYEKGSSLNSGSAILAFSNCKTVICPTIGTISDLDDQSIVLSYDYNNRDEHFNQLKHQIVKAVAMKKADSDVFSRLGKSVYDEVSTTNNKNKVLKQIGEVYYSLKK